jgi:hypothetical protein
VANPGWRQHVRASWLWWRELKSIPVYLREKGQWGKPNPFYDNLRRFSPFVVLGGLLLGLCGGFANPSLFLGDELATLACLLCLPGVLLNALTLFGAFMAPALTAPAISAELSRGTWDILRLTPQPTRAILMAKLLGALARLPVWRPLILLSVFQAALAACGTVVAGGADPANWWLAALLGASLVTRPWLEILFAGCLGMVVSTWLRSATGALAVSYGALLLFRLVNSGTLWLGVATVVADGRTSNAALLVGTTGPTVVYTLAIGAALVLLFYRAERMSF